MEERSQEPQFIQYIAQGVLDAIGGAGVKKFHEPPLAFGHLFERRAKFGFCANQRTFWMFWGRDRLICE